MKGVLSSKHSNTKGELIFSTKLENLKVKELKVFKSSKEISSETNLIRPLIENNLILSEFLMNVTLNYNLITFGKNQ